MKVVIESQNTMFSRELAATQQRFISTRYPLQVKV
jgi:hypothetical protein